MKNGLFCTMVLAALSGCAHAPSTDQPERPFKPPTQAAALVEDCKITVRFNTDESSVAESEYLGSMFCLGVMEGILNTHQALSDRNRSGGFFCLPDQGIKNWHAARAVVGYAKERPDLLEESGVEFSLHALASTYPCN